MKKIVDYLMDMIEGKDKKKIIENLIIVVIIGLIVLIAGSSLFGGHKTSEQKLPDRQESSAAPAGKPLNVEEEDVLEKDIANILSQIDGAGKVSVMITYVSGKELVPAYDIKKSDNVTEERDREGGNRSIKQNEYDSKMVYEEAAGGGKRPVVLKELLPEVRGVVVVADGAGDPVVKENMSRAVHALLDVPIHRIQVFERGTGLAEGR